MTPTVVRETVRVVALFGALTVVKTFPLVVNLRGGLPGGLGDPLLNAWILAWDADRMWHGLRGLWDAPIFFPYSNTLGQANVLLARSTRLPSRMPPAWSRLSDFKSGGIVS